MKYITAIVLATAAIFGLQAEETPVAYNWAGFQIGQFTVDDVPAGFEDSGLYLFGGGEAMINDDLIFSFNYEGAAIDDAQFLLTSEAISAGLLYRKALSPATDLVVGGYLVYGWIELDIPILNYNATDNDTGYGASVGLRHGFDEKNEIGLRVLYVSIFDDSSTTVSADFTHYTSGAFGIGGIISSSSDQTTFAVSMKFKTK